MLGWFRGMLVVDGEGYEKLEKKWVKVGESKVT